MKIYINNTSMKHNYNLRNLQVLINVLLNIIDKNRCPKKL